MGLKPLEFVVVVVVMASEFEESEIVVGVVESVMCESVVASEVVEPSVVVCEVSAVALGLMVG